MFGVYRALFLKSTTFQLRQLKTNIFQVIWVGALVGILLLVNSVDTGDDNDGYPPYTYVDNKTYNLFQTNAFTTWNGYIQAYTYYGKYYYTDPHSVASEILDNIDKGAYFGYLNYDYFWFNTTTPIILHANSVSEIDQVYIETASAASRWNQNYTQAGLNFVAVPTAGILFDTVQEKNLKFTIKAPSPNSYFSTGYNGFYITDEDDALEYTEIMVLNAFLKEKTALNKTVTMTSQPFPYQSYSSNIFSNFKNAIVGMLGLFFIPSALMFILPVFVFTIVSEKQDRLVEMMKMMGISMNTYWACNFTFSMLVYLILALTITIVGVIGKLPFFVDVNPMTYLLLFLLYGFAQVSFAFFMSTFFSKARTSVLISYFFVMLCSGIGATLQMIVFTTGPAPFLFLIFPFFALQRGIYLITYTTTGPFPANLISLSQYSGFGEVLLYLLFEAPFYFSLAVYLDMVIPRENGVSYSPLFPFQWAKRRWLARQPASVAAEKYALVQNDDLAVAEDDVVHQIEFEDEDCLRERRRVHSENNFLVKIVDLHKKYPGRSGQPAKDALVKFCLALEEGECLGLLGPNGAGKTSLISILCGLSVATSGTAYVSGFNIKDEMYKVHQILGFCPQHDILWQDLTIEEHLLFYCRLKGYSKSNEYAHVREIAATVGLGGEHLTKKVSELSGGMKRRLSISIALVGDSRLVLLDEPTTGLDPDTRRIVWDIINKSKATRSIIITTHNIDEADVLCSKIAIMSLGSLKCIGSALYLKNKFGAGYKLSAHLGPDKEKEENYKKFVKSMFKQAEPDPAAGTIDFIIPAADMDVSHVFSVMKQNKEQLGILEWAISQMSLEEVFLKMVAADESQF